MRDKNRKDAHEVETEEIFRLEVVRKWKCSRKIEMEIAGVFRLNGSESNQTVYINFRSTSIPLPNRFIASCRDKTICLNVTSGGAFSKVGQQRKSLGRDGPIKSLGISDVLKIIWPV